MEAQLYTESDLAQRLEMSRTPIREALKRLRAEQLVVLRPHGGVFVPPATPQMLDEVYTIRALLESRATGAAASKISPQELTRLREVCVLVEHNHVARRRERLGELYREFHDIILTACRMPILAALMSQVESHIERFRNASIVLPGVNSRAEHEEIIAALERGDEKAAEKMAYQHVMHLKTAHIDDMKKVTSKASGRQRVSRS